MQNSNEMTMVPCSGCSRMIRVPRHYWQTTGNDEVYCSTRCQRVHVGREGTLRKERTLIRRGQNA